MRRKKGRVITSGDFLSSNLGLIESEVQEPTGMIWQRCDRCARVQGAYPTPRKSPLAVVIKVSRFPYSILELRFTLASSFSLRTDLSLPGFENFPLSRKLPTVQWQNLVGKSTSLRSRDYTLKRRKHSQT